MPVHFSLAPLSTCKGTTEVMRASDLLVGIVLLVAVWATRAADLSRSCDSDQVATGVRVLVNGTVALLCEKPACTNWKFPALFPDCVRAEYCERNQYVMAISEEADGRREKKRRKPKTKGRQPTRPKFMLNCCQSAVKFNRAVRTSFLLPGQSSVGGHTFLKGSSEYLLVSAIDKFLLRRKGRYVYRTILSRVRCDLPIFLDELIRR